MRQLELEENLGGSIAYVYAVIDGVRSPRHSSLGVEWGDEIQGVKPTVELTSA